MCITQIPWQRGKCVAWNVTVADTLAASYLHLTAATSRVAERRNKKGAKYTGLACSFMFVSLRPCGQSTLQTLSFVHCDMQCITGISTVTPRSYRGHIRWCIGGWCIDQHSVHHYIYADDIHLTAS